MRNYCRAVSILFFLSCLITLSPGSSAAESVIKVSPVKANELIKNGAVDLILDVRTLEEYEGDLGRIKGAKLLPIANLEAGTKAIETFKNKTVLVYCHSGGRSNRAQEILRKLGFANVIDLSGGIVGWNKAGLPVEKSK